MQAKTARHLPARRARGFFPPRCAPRDGSRAPGDAVCRTSRAASIAYHFKWRTDSLRQPCASSAHRRAERVRWQPQALSDRLVHAPNAFVGNPKPFPIDWFSAVLSPVPLPQGETILTGVVPNIVTPEDCASQARRYWGGAPPARLWSLLIGGPSRNHLYAAQDWRDIATGVNTLAARHGIRWLISTSRRSGADAEAILEAEIAPEAVEELVLYSREPKRVVLPFLGAGERIFVTRDSLTMVSEAIMSGRPVTALLPGRVELAPDNFMAVVLRKYAAWAQFTEVPCTGLTNFVPPGGNDASAKHEAAEELDQAARHLAHALSLSFRETA